MHAVRRLKNETCLIRLKCNEMEGKCEKMCQACNPRETSWFEYYLADCLVPVICPSKLVPIFCKLFACPMTLGIKEMITKRLDTRLLRFSHLLIC